MVQKGLVMKINTLFLIAMIISLPIHAYELNGFIHENNDSTYAVTLYNIAGRYYLGNAELRADGTFEVRVQDMYGELYAGVAKKIHGIYELNLHNDYNGKLASGKMIFD